MKLYDHQIKALENTKDQNRVAYYHDMGLGKTFTGAEKMIQLSAPVNLIVCQKSKVQDWIDHFDKYYATNERSAFQKDLIFDLTNKKAFQVFISEAQQATEDNWIQDELTGEYYRQENLYPFNVVGVINYDLIWRRKELLQLQNFTLMLDESSLIQNPTSKRTKFIMKMKPENVILLSGTPVGGKYENLLTQIHLLGWKISKEVFWNQYVEWEWQELDGFWQKKILGYKNVDRLKDKLRIYGCDFLKTGEVLDLPKQNDIQIKINSTAEYKKFHKNSYVCIEGEELIGDTTLTKMLRERQLCSWYNKEKLQAFQDLLESTEDRVIIFYNFEHENEVLKEIAENLQRSVSVVNGQIKDLEAYEEKSDSVTLIQYQAGAMGLNLQKANKIIYFTPPLGSELFEQSKKRIHRIGQDRPCFYYYLICRRSIEEGIYKTLAVRKDYTEELFNEYQSSNDIK